MTQRVLIFFYSVPSSISCVLAALTFSPFARNQRSRDARIFSMRVTTVEISDFFAADKNLSVVCVLDNHCVLGKRAEVVSEDAIEEGA